MDSERFDGLVRSFGQTRSRRQTLRGLAGLAAIGALALGGQEADASKRNGGSPCTRGRQCKTGKCVGDPGQKVCSCSKKYPKCTTSGSTCQDGTCTDGCPEGSQAINGGCFRSESCGAGCGSSNCGAGFDTCYCAETVGGVPVCFKNDNFCSEGDPSCDADGDCPTGKACVDVSCFACGGPAAVCLAPCPVSPPGPGECGGFCAPDLGIGCPDGCACTDDFGGTCVKL